MMEVLFIICFGMIALEDFVKKEIKKTHLLLLFMLGLVCWCFVIYESPARPVLFQIFDGMLGGFVGVFICAVSYISKEQVGIGDGIVLIITGLILGIRRNMFLLCFGLASLVVCMIPIFVIKKIQSKVMNRKYRLPFVPYLFIAYVVIFFLDS